MCHVTKLVTVQTLLAMAVTRKWEIHQMDVHNVFLHGDLAEEAHIKFPPRFQTATPDKLRLF